MAEAVVKLTCSALCDAAQYIAASSICRVGICRGRGKSLLAAPCAMAARAISSTSSSGRGKCSRLGVLHREKRKAASTSMCTASVTASTTASQNNTLHMPQQSDVGFDGNRRKGGLRGGGGGRGGGGVCVHAIVSQPARMTPYIWQSMRSGEEGFRRRALAVSHSKTTISLYITHPPYPRAS